MSSKFKYDFFRKKCRDIWCEPIEQMKEKDDIKWKHVDKEKMVKNKKPFHLMVTGGDGSLHKAINWIADNEACEIVKILYCPSGTGNDYSRSVGLWGLQPSEILDYALENEVSEVYLGRLNKKSFINMASVGVFAEVTPEVDPTIKSFLGPWSYYIKGLSKLTNLQPQFVSFSINGKQIYEGNILGFFVGKSNYTGGGVQVTAEASPFEATLDLMIIKDRPISELLSLGLELQKESPQLEEFAILYKKIKEVDFASEKKLSLSLDGEKESRKKGHFKLHPDRCQIYLPKHERS